MEPLSPPERLIIPPITQPEYLWSSEKFYNPPASQPEFLPFEKPTTLPEHFGVSFLANMNGFIINKLGSVRSFFGNHRLRLLIASSLPLAAAAPMNFPEIQPVVPPQQEISAPVSKTVVAAIENLKPAPSLESTINVETGRSFENILSIAYGIPEEHLVKVSPAIQKTETGNDPKSDNPMQVDEETMDRELRDFKARVGEEEYDLIFTGQNPVGERVIKAKIRYAYYYTLVEHTFSNFSQQTKKDITLIYFNGGSSIAEDTILWAVRNSPTHLKNADWQYIYNFMHDPEQSSSFQKMYGVKYNFKRRPYSKWLENVNHYVEKEKAFEKN